MIDSIEDLQERLAEVPSAQLLAPQEILREYPHLQDDQRAIKLIAVEAYVRELERGNRLTPAEFVHSYPAASAGLAGELEGLAELHSRLGLWSVGAPQQEVAFPQVGEIVRGYKLLQEIGRGAFSRVFLAADSHVGHRRVAVKFTPHAGNELTSLGTLMHPHLPRIFTCVHDADRDLWMICMEYIGTRSAVDLVQELHGAESGRPVSMKHKVSRAVAVVRQIADALDHAHEHGTLHLDVKPANILLRSDGAAVLIDFNLSAPACSGPGLVFRGTLAYAAPEVIESAMTGDLAATPISTACDIFSLGVVLFELLTGHLPWAREDSKSEDDAIEALAAQQARETRPSVITPNIDPELDEIVATALAFTPEKRFESMRDFRDALDRYQGRIWRRSPAPRSVLAVSTLVILGFVVFQPSPGDQQAAQFSSLDRSRQNSVAAAHRLSEATRDLAGVESARVAPLRGIVATREERPRVRWAQLSENELWGIYQLMESTPAMSGDGVHAAARGYVLMLLQDYRNAAACFRSATQHGLSRDVGVNANLGYCYIQQRQFGGASRFLDVALETMPESEVLLFLRSVVSLEMSQHLNRRGDRTHLDRLIAIETPLADRFVAALLQHLEVSTESGTQVAFPTLQKDSRRMLTSARESDPRLVGATDPDGEVVDLIRSESVSYPLPAVYAALAADVNLTTRFHDTVEAYLDMIHRLHLSSRLEKGGGP